MNVIVNNKNLTHQAQLRQPAPAEKPKSVHDDRREVPMQWLGRAGGARQAVRILRCRAAVILASGVLCLAQASPPLAPSFTTQPASQVVAAGNNATFTAAASGSPSYQWFFAFNGVTNLLAAGSSVIVTGSYANVGDYFCVASNSYGMTTSSVAWLSVQYAWSEYGYSGGWQYYYIPSGVTNLAVDAVGAGGGSGGNDASVAGYAGGGRIWFWGVASVTTGGTVTIGLGATGGGGGSSVGGSGAGGGGYSPWGGVYGGSGGNAGNTGTSGGGGGGGGLSLIEFPSSLSYPDLVLGGAGGGGGGGINGANGSSSGGYASADLPSSSGYYPGAYGGGAGAGSSGDGGGGGGSGAGIWGSVGGGVFGTGDHIGGGGSGGYSFEPDNVAPTGNSWNHSTYNAGASSGVCAFRPAPLARISMPGPTVTIVSGQSLSLTVQFFTQDTVEYVQWYRNGSYYTSTSVTSLGNYAYNSTLAFGTGYANGDVWTVQIETYLESYWGQSIYPVSISSAATLNVISFPAITSEPTNQTVTSGGSASFSVAAIGAAPLSYQWRDNSASISGATNTSFSLSATRSSDAGSYTVAVSNSYGAVTSSVAVLTVNKATPVVTTWPTASGITFLQALSASTLSGGSASVGGIFAFTTPASTPPVGTYAASVTFTPTDTDNYITVAGSVNVAVVRATPIVSVWPAASAITYGQALSLSTLSGGSASTGGSFAFALPGNTPNAGTYYASVVFTPTGAASYNAVTGTVAVVVNKATPIVTVWPAANGITYGQNLSASTLGSGSATPGGVFSFTAPLTAPGAGTYTAAVTFTPTDTLDYGGASGTTHVAVSKATPTVATWPAASGIVFGQSLAASLLSGGSASTSGAFSFDSPTNMPNAGTYAAALTFTPADTADYNPVSGSTSVTVAQAAQVITLQLQVSDSIPLNQFTNVPILATASSGLPVVLSLATNSVAAFDETGTNLVSIELTGTVTLLADQSGNTNYLAATEVVAGFDVTLINQTITFAPIPPQVTTNLTWPLTATSDSGLPALFTVVSGPATLDFTGTNLTFTGAGSVVVQAAQPGDGTNYNAAVPVMQSVQVSLAQSSITWSALPASTFGDAPFTLDGVSSSGDAVNYTSWNTNVAVVQNNVVTIVGAGTAVISAQDAGDNFYTADTVQQVLTVVPATPALTLPTASSITFGQSLASATLTNGSAELGANAVSGGFAFVDPSITPNAGAYVASIVFTPADTTDYTGVLTNVSVVVAPLAPGLIALPASAPIIFGQSLAASALINGSASVPGSFAFADSTVIPGSAGAYSAAVVFTPTDSNYATIATNVNVAVEQAAPVVNSWPTTTPINFGNPLSASTLVGGSGTPSGTFAFNDPTAILNVGTNFVLVVFTPDDSTDYATVTGSVAVVVAQGLVEITVMPTASPITFGQSLASSTLSGGNATVGGSFTFQNGSIIPSGAGTYNAAVVYTPTNANYSAIVTNVAVTVNKAVAAILLSDTNQSYTGAARSVTVSTTPAGLTVVVTYNGSNTPPVTAGSYAVSVTINDTNYTGSATGTLLVGQLPLLVAAQGVTRFYGGTNAPFAAAITGFINGENQSNLTGSLSFTVQETNDTIVSVDTNTPAGTYTIIPGGLSSSDYTITYSNATLLVIPAILTVTADSLTNVYGSPMPALAWSYQGFVNGEGTNVLSGAPSLSTNLSSGSPVAGSPYTITIASGTLMASNYIFTNYSGTFTVLPAPLVVSANSVTNVYGSPMSSLTGSMAGVTNNDPLSVSFVTAATQSSSVGAYNILPSFNDPDLLVNYTVTTNIGTFTVVPAPLLITANPQTRYYGYANPTLTLAYTGFVLSDDSSALTVQPTVTTTATLASLVGSYPITVGGAFYSNYTISYSNSTMTVTKAPLTVVGNDATRAYGSPNPAFTATITGIVNNDNITSRFSTSANTNSPPGNYVIQLSLSDPGGKLGQYSATLNSGILTVSGATLIGQVQSFSRAYGQTNPAFTVSYSGFVNSQDASLISGDLSFSCVDTNGVNVNTNSPVGVYPIAVATGQTAPNYVIQYTNGALTITQAVLTVAALDTNRLYGATNPVFAATIAGYVNGEDSNVLNGTLAIASPSDAASPVGTYPIVPSGISATNYSINFTDGLLTVAQAPLSVCASNASRLYGQSNPALTGSVAGLANNDNLGLSFVTAATPASPVGNYDIVPTFGDPDGKLANYQISTTNGTLIVGQTPLAVVAANQSRPYGQSNPTLTGTVSGVMNGDNITASYSTTATAQSVAGPYSIVPAINDPGSHLANYTVSFTNGTLTVTQAVLIVSANAQSRLYGATNPTLTVAYSGFVNGEGTNVISGQPDLNTAANPASPVGAYDIVVGLGSLSATNYSFSLTNGTLTVGKALLTVTADPQNRLYGQTNPLLTVSYNGFVDGDGAGVLSGTPALSTVADTNTPVGSYDIVATNGTLTATNYALSFVNGTLTINATPLGITALDATRQYGTTNPVFDVTMQGFVNNESAAVLGGTLLVASTAGPASAVGTYEIVPSGLTSTNYALSFTNGTLTVSPAPLTVTAGSTNRIYGQSNPVLTGVSTATVNGDDLGMSFATTATSSNSAGQYPIFPVFADPANKLGNYLVTTNAGTLTVSPALLTVTADNQNRAYGQTNPALTVSYSGFVNGDTAANLGTQPAAGTAAGPASFTGQYPITVSGGVSSNYTFSYVAGTLTIGQADLTVIGDDATRAYGYDNPVFTSTVTGLANNDNITVSYQTLANLISPPGTYVIVLQINDPNGLLGQYNLTLISGTLTVTNAALIVTVDDQNRSYGQANPPFTVHYNGFVNSQGTNNLRGALTFSCLDGSGRPAGTNTAVGSYAITASGLSATNYTVRYVPGTLAIARVPLTVTGASAQRLYGATNPAFTATLSGFVNSETSNVLSGTLSVTSLATPSSPVGSYSIIPGGLTSGNYSLSFVNGTLTVNPVSLTGSAQNVQRGYGQTNPPFTVSYSGFVNNENSGVVTGSIVFDCLDTNNAPVTTNTPVGIYPVHVITPQTAPNYTISYLDGSLTVTQAVLIVSANPQSRLYGATNPPLTVAYSGFLNGEGTNVISGQPDLNTAANLASPVGAYDIVVGLGSLSATNYSFSLTNGTLTVGKALLTVTADPQSRLYGQTNPLFTVSYSGFVDGDGAGVLSGTPALSTAADTNTPVGSYDIVATNGTLTATNYALSFVNGTLTINATPLGITALNATRQYGTTNPVFDVTMQGFVNNENAVVLGGTLLVASAAGPASAVGTYDIVPSGLTSTNYALSFTNGTLTVSPAPLTVTANSYIRQYGITNPVFSGTISGLLNGDPITAAYNCAATQSSPAGSYAITPSLNDPESRAGNYAVTLQAGSLTITVALTQTAATNLYVVGNPAIFMDTNVVVADGGGLGFGGGTLSVTVITNAATNDVLGIASQGNGAGQIGVQATNVSFGGVSIAGFSGGNGLNPLVFLLNTNANSESATVLARQLTFATTSTNTNFCVIQTALTIGSNTVLAQYVITLDRPPFAPNLVITAAQGQTIQIPFSRILTNIFDADGNNLTISESSEVSADGGWIGVNSNAFVYDPPQGLAVQDRFAYLVEDGRGGSCVGVIIINFMSTNLLRLDISNISTTGAALTLAGVPGQTYLIQTSTNLVNWTDLSAGTADTMGIIQVLDAAAKNYPQRFYRAISQ
jgi:hypothetical protein